MEKKTSNVKKIISLAMCFLLAISVAAPAFAAQKISNPGNRGGVDGIDADPEIGVHNSYAWCSEVFKQADADYIWVGMNRDMGAILIGGAEPIFPLSMIGIPDQSPDTAGRIYRQRVSDPEAEWELVYENKAISGYRKMIVFNDDLYVLAGLSNRVSLSEDYSIVLRFSKNYMSGDDPEIVFWENVTGNTTEYFRSAAVLDGKLYIGTFDSKIYVTDGMNLVNLSPNNGPKDTGWELALTLPVKYIPVDSASLPPIVPISGTIWDLLAFNGSVYAFVAYTIGYVGVSAFGVYRITPEGGGYEIRMIVGDAFSKYPYGMGISKNMTASGFLSTSFGEDYVYVSTFANGPTFMGALALGNFDNAFNLLFCPAQMYRFDKNDNWEVVVGDTSGPNIAVDIHGQPLDFVGNQRAGFFLQDEDYHNVSFNQYIWWMIEHEGKLYATTWDTSVFKQYYGLLILYVFNKVADNALMMLMEHVLAMEEPLRAILENYAQVDMQAFAEELGAYLQQIKDSLELGCELSAEDIVDGFLEILGKYFPLEDQQELRDAICAMVDELLALDLDPREIITGVLAFISATSMYFLDESNPAGFDLFVSEDGMNFEPVTVDGFGDPCNYGGRVLVSSGHGLYVTTANPFNGGQVWRLTPMESGIYANGPAAVELGKIEQAVMTVLVTDAGAGSEPVVRHDGKLVSVRLVKRGSPASVADITWDNKICTNPLTGKKFYTVCESETIYETQMYDVVFKPIGAGSERITLEFSIGGVSSVRAIDVTVNGRFPSNATTTPKDFVSMVETAKNSRIWVLTFKATLTYPDGKKEVVTYSIRLNGNNANLDGKYKFPDDHDLAGFTLVYDVKGNGSNIKELKLMRS